jgi:hypothetical protein
MNGCWRGVGGVPNQPASVTVAEIACARVGRMQAAGVGAHSSSTSLGTSVVGRTSVDAWTVAFFSGRGVRRRPVEALPGYG